MQPQLLGNEFTHLEFPRRVQRKEVGKRMLYRDFTMSGWAYKTIEDDDLKFPLIYGEGKKVRVAWQPLTDRVTTAAMNASSIIKPLKAP
ncbi:Protein phosphatase 1H [Ameca splendens]|uniref:Protein phosphatase 1H n=1 Tax=Ameca splendens TaxID=208324 RepID=A0ABV0YH67_9TELE